MDYHSHAHPGPFHLANGEAMPRASSWSRTQILSREPLAPYATNYGEHHYRPSPPPVGKKVCGGVFHEVGVTNPHRAICNGTSRPLQSDVTNHAPYAARLTDSSVFFSPGRSASVTTLPAYSSLNDPHLYDYFRKKFASIPRPPSGRRSAASSSSRLAGKARSRPGTARAGKVERGVLYRVAVTTGDKKGGGTDAKVFVRINGTKGKLPKRQLTKKPGSASRKKKPRFKFSRGTCHIFKFEGKDVGELTSIVLEHDGLTKEQGWYVEQVEIIKRYVRTGQEKSWIFLCQQWLSLHAGDCQISRELFAKSYTKTEYEVVAVTGNMKGAGTDANVFMTLFGKTGQTPKLQLKNNSKDCFERNQSDIFVLKTQCVGPMTKIRIEHDNKGFAPGWYLDRIVVTDMKNPKWKYYFPCGQWLAKSEGDGQISRDLIGSRDPLAVRKFSQYKVTVYTGNKRGAGTDADVFVTLFGESGDSGERKLDTKRNNFERGQTDEFILDCPSLGTLKRLRISHNNKGFSAGWFLDKVIVDDVENNRVYEFPCGRWLAKDEDDGQISRDLLPGIGIDQAPPGVPYNIQVTTGDEDHAGTSARVYIVLYGGKGGDKSSGKIWLENGKFKRGRTDIFNVDVAEPLSPLSRIDIGHDNSGAGAGWYLDRVMVNCPSRGIEQWFLCDKWLARSEGDGLIERTLHESKGMRKERKGLITWFVRIYTSDLRGAGTDANVHLVAYGRNKDGEYLKSDEITLDNQGDNFESGQMDQFKVEMVEIGKPYKIRIGHDNKGAFAGWHLNRVEMENMATKKQYHFKCNRWLATDEDDGAVVREMPAEGETIKHSQPLLQYLVQVYTGKKRGAGTDANVFINVFGEQGDTGDRPLTHSKTNRNKFEKGDMDEFVLEAVDLKRLKKIRIGHDGSKPGAGWFLDKVIVKEMGDSRVEAEFPCNRWLDVNEDDGLIVREITAGGSQMLSTTSYHVSVKTGDVWGAGTDANIFIKIFGDKGDSGKMQLKSADNTKNKFERDRTDQFKLETGDIGKLEKIRIGHDGAAPGSGWFLDEVRIDVPSKGEHYTFACHRWLDSKEEDGQLEVELEPTDIRKGAAKIPYEVTVWTGDKRGAGTDSNVFLQMYGEYGKTEEYQLRNKTDNFEQGQMDKFKLEMVDVGPLLKIRVGHDGAGMFSGWFLDKILIQRHPTKGSKRRKRLTKQASFKTIGRSIVESDSENEGGRRSPRSRPRSASLRHRNYDYDSDEGRRSPLGRPRSVNGRRKSEYSRFDSDDDHYSSRDGHRPPYGRPRSASVRRGTLSRYESDSEEEKRRYRKDSYGRRKSRYENDFEDDRTSTRPKSASLRRKSQYGDDDWDKDRSFKRSKSSAQRRQSRYRESDSEDDRRSVHSRSASTKRRKYQGDSDFDSEEEWQRKKRPSSARGSARGSRDSDEDRKKRRKSLYASTKRNIYDSDDETGRGDRRKSLHKHRDDSDDSADERKRGKKAYQRKFERDRRKEEEEEETEDYWFVVNRWFAKGEDDGKIVRELLPTDEQGNPLKTGLQEVEYDVAVFTGDVFGAGTDANVFITITGEYGDTGERALKESNHRNKFERNQEDIFKLKAVDLGRLKKVKIRHDNKGGGGAWFLGYIEVTNPTKRETYFFPCQRWLATDEDDGQICRELVPVDQSLKRKLSTKDSKGIRDEIALETKAALTTYHVYVYTGDKFGAGTDANVYIMLYGDTDDTGKMVLKTSKTNRDKFERAKMDEFVLEAVDIGNLRKIKIGHDNSGLIGGGAWLLEKVEIDCPSLGKKWYFPCGRWLAKDKDDGKLERELHPQTMATEEYEASPGRPSCIGTESGVPYEITTYTTDKSGASTDANVHITIYGTDTCTSQKPLCSTKKERKSSFKRAAADKFVLEMEDVGDTIEKIRVGHDGKGFGAGWHLDKVEVRRLKESGRPHDGGGSETYTFPCGRWLARDEDDGAIERELVPDKLIEEKTRKDGSIKKKDVSLKGTLQSKRYTVNVITGDVRGAGTDANVFLIIFGDRGDTGERKLHKSETNRDKFERGQEDRFVLEAVDLGKIFKIKIRHDNSMFSPAWFLDRVEITDTAEGENYVFHCERWLGKNKDDGKIERSLYVKGYDGTMSSTSTLRHGPGSIASLDSLKSTDPFSKSPRMSRRQREMEDIPEGPTIPYTVRVKTGEERDMGTDSTAWIKIMGSKRRHTGKQYLELAQKSEFRPGSQETFSLEAPDVKEVRQIELGHDGVTPGSGWYVKEVEVDLPTKGKHYFFTCKTWLAKDKGEGKTSKVFTVNEGASSVISYKPLVPYEVTVHTGDVSNAGTDAQIFIKLFGRGGATSDIMLDKLSDRFERARSDLIKVEMEDIAPIKKLRIGHDGKGQRPDWFVEKVELRNMETGDFYVFKTNSWLSRTKDDKLTIKDFVAYVKGKPQLKTTQYRVHVKTSDLRGAGTDANVYIVMFGENGDSGERHLKKSETNKSAFENNQTDVFTLPEMLSLGQLMKIRVWHDNKGLGASWHLSHIEVEDCGSGQRYMFSCNRWLSRSEDDRQICRELSCANLPSPGVKDKIKYEIEVSTSDKKEAGTTHHAWLILEGDQRSSKEFIMENGSRNKILRKGQTDTFTMVSRNLGTLERCLLGAIEREDKPASADDRWHCYEVAVTNKQTGDRYVFGCKSWIQVARNISKRHAKVLELKQVEESKLTATRNLGSVKYEVIVVTGDERGAGTDANVSITIYGSNGDTGKRELKQKFRDLFERGRTDKFQLEAVDLGDLTKIRIEHDDKGWGSGWLLDHVEIINLASNRQWNFPCGQWLDKKKGDGQICRELMARD